MELAGDSTANVHLVTITDFESDDPRVRTYLDTKEQYDPGHPAGFYHAGGYAVGEIFVEALERAGRDLNREKLIAALETFEGWDANAWRLPLTYAPGVRGGSAATTYVSKVDFEQGKLVRATEDAVFEMPDF